jgi:hypothetical protein
VLLLLLLLLLLLCCAATVNPRPPAQGAYAQFGSDTLL